MSPSNPQLSLILRQIREKGFPFEPLRQAEGESVLYRADKADCVIELWDSGRLTCQFGIDMEELRNLVSGSGNEDIAEDELQRVARDHLRPLSRRYGPGLKELGYEEIVDTAEHHYAISFEKTLNLSDPPAVLSEIQGCLSILS
jgi:hypothetical protein